MKVSGKTSSPPVKPRASGSLSGAGGTKGTQSSVRTCFGRALWKKSGNILDSGNRLVFILVMLKYFSWFPKLFRKIVYRGSLARQYLLSVYPWTTDLGLCKPISIVRGRTFSVVVQPSIRFGVETGDFGRFVAALAVSGGPGDCEKQGPGNT